MVNDEDFYSKGLFCLLACENCFTKEKLGGFSMSNSIPDASGYEKNFSDESFMSKAAATCKGLGKDVLLKALLLYCAAKAKGTPIPVRAAVIAALGYFISPVDAVPDMIPVLGYADDAAVLAATLATIASYITPEVRDKATKI